MFIRNTVMVILSVGMAAAATAKLPLNDIDKYQPLTNQQQSRSELQAAQPVLMLAESQRAEGPVSEREFVRQAAAGGLAEIKMGELAQQQSDNEEVRRFAIEIANDYENAYEKLRVAASEMDIETANNISAEQQQQYDELAKLSGDEFDRAYIGAKVKDLTKTVEMYRLEARKGDASEVQLFAAYIVPKLEQHLAAAQDIDEALKDPDSSDRAKLY